MADDPRLPSTPADRGQHPLLRLEALCARLRGEGGCPWDRAQTMSSLTPYILEEAYEVLDAVEQGADAPLREEMGDLFFLLFLMLEIAREEKRTDVEEVVEQIVEKMIRRHPHVFGGGDALSYDRAMTQWEEIKQGEVERTHSSVLNEIGETMPALLLAYRIQEKAAAVGFDWPAIEPVVEKVEEEVRELREAVSTGDRGRAREELGDLLFACVNLSRFLETDPERLLRGTIRKFRARFRYIEEELAKQGRTPAQSTLEEMDRLWERSKGLGLSGDAPNR